MRAILIVILLMLVLPPVNGESLRFAVLDFQGIKVTRERWQPLTDYLSNQLNIKVTLLPVKNSPLTVRARQFDIILTNPVATALIIDKYHYKAVATLNHKHQGAFYAGVIITLRDSKIQTLSDLANKRVGVVDKKFAAGGFMFQAYELVKAGLEPAQDFNGFIELNNQIAITKQVVNGSLDAGFLRTGMLEDISNGLADVDVSQIRIVNRQEGIIRYPRSTDIYPHWGVIVAPSFSDELRNKLTKALLNLAATDPAANAASISGFVEAADYAKINQAIKALRDNTELGGPLLKR